MNILFVAPAAACVGLSTAAAGLTKALQDSGKKVAFFKAISHDAPTDHSPALAAALGLQVIDSIQLADAENTMASGELDELLESVVAKADAAIRGADVLVVEGVAFNLSNGYAAKLNAELASALGAQTVLVARYGASSNDLRIAASNFRRGNGGLAGAIVGFAPAGQAPELDLPADLPLLSKVASGEQHGLDLGEGSAAAGNVTELKRGIDEVADRLDVSGLQTLFAKLEQEKRLLSPSAFRFDLIKKASQAGKRIVLPEGEEPRTVAAAIRCAEKGIARPVLLAKKEDVKKVAEEQGLGLPEGLEIIEPDSIREQYVAPMVELRKSKGLTPEQAREQLQDTVVLGTMMLAQGDVDGLVSGAVHTTASTVRPALQLIKTAPSNSLVSSVFFMLMPEQVLVYGDAAINPNPTAEQLAEIAMQSADSAKAFGLEPRVAMLSYSTGTSGSGDDVEKVKAATAIVKEKRPELAVDGPLQYDAASVESVAKSKAKGSPVAGKANVFIFPDLNSGNIGYKAVQRNAGVVAVGPMLQGLRKPVNDLSRGALIDDIVYTIALTAIQAVQKA